MGGEPSGARYLAGASGHEVLAVAVAEAGATLGRASLRSVHTRPGRSVSHVYEATLTVAEQEQEVLLVAHADRQPLPAGAFQLERDEARVAVWRFPNDPYLPGLPSAVDAGRVQELLLRLGVGAEEVRLRTRAYRPSRRAVVEVTVTATDQTGRVLYLKVLSGERAQELAEIHRHLSPHLPVPRVVGVAPRQGIVALEALEGHTLRSLLVEGGELPPAAQVLALSESFTAAGSVSGRDPRAYADPRRHVPLLCSLAPEREDVIRQVADRVAGTGEAVVAVHGDLHDGQLLVRDGDLVGVLDLDGSGYGSLAHDAGNLIAHVQVVGELWPKVAARCERYAGELAEAYRELVAAPSLARATAAAWLGLATGPYRAQDADWPTATRQRIDRARAALTGVR